MAEDFINSYMTGPDEKGRFGIFGGRFVSETLMPLILELEKQYEFAKTDQSFWDEMEFLWKHYVGRPSPLYFAERQTWNAVKTLAAVDPRVRSPHCLVRYWLPECIYRLYA